jgi:hypothetical protein
MLHGVVPLRLMHHSDHSPSPRYVSLLCENDTRGGRERRKEYVAISAKGMPIMSEGTYSELPFFL